MFQNTPAIKSMVMKRKKEDEAMRKRMGAIVFLLFTGLILGTTQPVMVSAGETGGGNIWDPFIDPRPYPGIWLAGPLSIYYEYVYDEGGNVIPCSDTGGVAANMFVTVRLNKVLDMFRLNPTLYTFQYTNGTCTDDWITQGTEIKNFLGTVVVPGIYPDFKSWKLMSVTKAQYHDDDFSRAFVSDIAIAVKIGRLSW